MGAGRYGIFASRAENPFKTLQFILYSNVIFAAFVDFDNISINFKFHNTTWRTTIQISCNKTQLWRNLMIKISQVFACIDAGFLESSQFDISHPTLILEYNRPLHA